MTSGFQVAIRSVIGEVARGLPLDAQQLVESAVRGARDYARANAPVRTGTLRSSQTYSVRRTPGGAEGEAVSGSGYDAYVNYGTNDTPADPFMSRAAREAEDRWDSDWKSLERRLPRIR